MGGRTSHKHGTFSWVDLGTTDQDDAKAFYSGLLGWEYDDMPAGDGITYSMAKVGDKHVAAISPQMQQEREMGIPPHWNNYVTVDDIDAVAGRVGELGGQLLMPPFDVMEAGRMAVLMDPSGAALMLWHPKQHIGAGLVNAPGAFCWNELATRDPQAAQDFYSALLGWSFDKMEGGPADAPPYWGVMNGDRMNGGMLEMSGDAFPPEIPSYWGVYFAVDSVQEAADKAAGSGGNVTMPKTEIPGRGAFAMLTDPQGVHFSVYEGTLED